MTEIRSNDNSVEEYARASSELAMLLRVLEARLLRLGMFTLPSNISKDGTFDIVLTSLRSRFPPPKRPNKPPTTRASREPPSTNQLPRQGYVFV